MQKLFLEQARYQTVLLLLRIFWRSKSRSFAIVLRKLISKATNVGANVIIGISVIENNMIVSLVGKTAVTVE